jgi:hypothetical protein
MTKEEHEEIFKCLLATTKKIFDHDAFLAPVVHCIKEKETAVYVIAEMPNENAKNQVEKLIVKLVDEGAEGICFASECWMLDGEHWDTHKKYRSVADNPNRIEVLMVTYSTKRFEMVAFAKIIREDEDPWEISFSGDKKPVRLGEWDSHTNEGNKYKSEGRFARFWEKARALHAAEN